MRFYRPRTFLSLLLTGFIFVSLPMVIALFSSVQILDGVVQQSAVAVFRSVSRVDNSRKLADLLHDQERSARLYNVLGDPAHLDELYGTTTEIDAILQQFAANNDDADLLYLIHRLDAQVQHIVAVLTKTSGGPELLRKSQLAALSLYTDVGTIAVQLERLSNSLMIAEVDALKESVQKNKTTLVWQVTGLIGFSVLLVILFISIIVKPVSQIDKAIERLGEGDFATPVAVSGPIDLESLGEKLNWLRKRLAKLDREKVKMIAHISHELKTPLASIKEGAGLLKDGLVGALSASQEEVVNILDTNCVKLQRLIENILDFNMAEAKESPIDLTEINLGELLREVAADHHNLMLARNITLQMALDAALVSGNRKQIKTIFDNLLSNAVKFSPDSSTIDIYMRNKVDTVSVIVEDQGEGISEEDRPQIFLPFFKGKKSSQSGIKGSGLGLAITKEYVQNCGGSIRLLPSERGARFSVTLPRVRN
ncbi:sensor histidine kinase [Desulfogranum japonicum]|uniref:sensor histidine kinase n=1 Tax=Desulfogranum japonicum TaxID=231447 RepID=UPI00041983B0|nr:sensor histidine kinase [Desulfogranum japonicum]